MYIKEYPNLELLDYKTRENIKKISGSVDTKRLEILAEVFPQIWASTSLGFGGYGGSALTTAYTTVMYSKDTNLYFIYYGNELAYFLDNPNEYFFKDLKNRDLKPVIMSNKYITKDK